MIMKDTIVKFFIIYLVFILFALSVNLSMEILIPPLDVKARDRNSDTLYHIQFYG